MIVFYFILFAAVVYLLLPVGGVRSNKIASLLLICNAFSFLVALILALFAFITPIAANYTSQDSVYRCIALINFSVFFVLSIRGAGGGTFSRKEILENTGCDTERNTIYSACHCTCFLRKINAFNP